MSNSYCVYILGNKWNHVLYIGVTNDLKRRVYEHREKLVEGFTKRYNINRLVYYEATEDVYAAIEREKQMKSWSRKRKNELVESMNPKWDDLYDNI